MLITWMVAHAVLANKFARQMNCNDDNLCMPQMVPFILVRACASHSLSSSRFIEVSLGSGISKWTGEYTQAMLRYSPNSRSAYTRRQVNQLINHCLIAMRGRTMVEKKRSVLDSSECVMSGVIATGRPSIHPSIDPSSTLPMVVTLSGTQIRG